MVAEAAKHRYNRRKRADNLYFYRDVKRLECDLLYPTGQDIAAFEVKSGATISADYFKSLHRVAELVPNVTSKFVVYGGTEAQSRSDSKVVPLAILGGTLARLEESRETAAFVGRNKGPAPDEADVGALDLVFTRSIRPVLDALDTELAQISELFRRVVLLSYVSMDGSESNSSELLKAHYWPQTKTGIVADGFKLSSTRSLGIRHTYTFETYTGDTRATEKSRSGQDRGQQGGVAPDFVPQQSDGQIRSEILLNRAHHVQCGPSEDAHHGGGVAPAHATVVFPELHVQGTVQAVLAPRGAPASGCG